MGRDRVSEDELIERAQQTVQGIINDQEAKEGLTEDETVRYLEYVTHFRSIKSAILKQQAYYHLAKEAYFLSEFFSGEDEYLIGIAKDFENENAAKSIKAISDIYGNAEMNSGSFKRADWTVSKAIEEKNINGLLNGMTDYDRDILSGIWETYQQEYQGFFGKWKEHQTWLNIMIVNFIKDVLDSIQF